MKLKRENNLGHVMRGQKYEILQSHNLRKDRRKKVCWKEKNILA